MTQEDLQQSRDLEQEVKETRYLIAQNWDELKAARFDAAGFKLDVSNGIPGARLELDAATTRAEELEARGRELEERLLSSSQAVGNMVKWDTQARSLARENGLNEGQMERLFEAFKAGKTRADVLRMAQHIQRAENTVTAPLYAFQQPGDVAW